MIFVSADSDVSNINAALSMIPIPPVAALGRTVCPYAYFIASTRLYSYDESYPF